MKTNVLSLIGLFLIGVLANTAPAFADPTGMRAKRVAVKHPRRAEAGARQANQHDRIQQGVRSGELTKEEAQTLRAEQKEVRETKREALKDDGKISRDEMKEIRKEQNEASQNIYEEKHDTEKR